MTALYRFWNARINLISRKDVENIELHHILHSLSIAKFFPFTPGTRILDAGTGGGFPGIPLAVLFPEAEFTLADSILKKIGVVENIKNELGLTNVIPVNCRFENVSGNYDFITGRAISSLPELWKLIEDKIPGTVKNGRAGGLLYLKGGEFTDELNSIHAHYEVFNLSDIFSETFFKTKKLIHLFKK
jgi:16S rRNA (guanine527-N7)-methyltransferase